MTIKEFAKNHGVSSQAIYGKLSSKGVAVSSIVQPDSKQITDEGMSILKRFYQADDSLIVKVQALQSSNRQLQKQVEMLQKQLDEVQATQAQVDLLKMQLEMMIEAKNQAQKNAADWKELVMRLTTPKLTGTAEDVKEEGMQGKKKKRWFGRK